MTRFETYDPKKHRDLFPPLEGYWSSSLPPGRFANICVRRGRVSDFTWKKMQADAGKPRGNMAVIEAIEPDVAPVRDYMRAIVEKHCEGHDLVLWIAEYEYADMDGNVLRQAADFSDTWEFMIRAWFVIPGDTRPPLRDPDEMGAVPLFRPDA